MSVYRKPQPYRKSQTYRGLETLNPVVPPTLFGATITAWREADDHGAPVAMPWHQAPPRAATTGMRWQTADRLAGAIAALWRDAQPHQTDIAMPWSTQTSYAIDGRHPWRQSAPHSTTTATPWEQFAQRLAEAIGAPWRSPATHQFSTALRWAALAKYGASTSTAWKRLAERGAYVALPWGTGSHFQTGYTTPFTNPPDGDTPLAFPDLPVYIMLPTITAIVIDTSADLQPLSVTVNADVDSFDRSFEMQIPAVTRSLVDPATNSEPVAIRVTINGYSWSFIVDSCSDNRKFGGRGFTVRGGSRSRLLGDEFALTHTLLQTDDFNAAQLADHELDSTGWTMIWDAVDWLVSGGLWTYADLTPIAALQQLAASIGATLETDEDALNIHVRPRYPIKPWAWDSATPYAIVPASVLVIAAADWRGGNNANGIYVYPQNSTSGAFVRITGSGGTSLLKMVVDPLLTDTSAQSARGVQELANAGRKKQEVLTIPLFPAPALPGLIPLRSLLEVTDESGATWRGQVMSSSISAGRSSSAISVRQALTVERQIR